MFGPVIEAVDGTTDSMAEPSVDWTMVNWPVTVLPVVTSVARMTAGCVGTPTDAWMITLALPLPSDTTVNVEAKGAAGLLVRIENAPLTTSNLTARLGIPAPPAPVTCTAAVAVSPEHTVFAPHAVRAGVMVSVLNMGAGSYGHRRSGGLSDGILYGDDGNRIRSDVVWQQNDGRSVDCLSDRQNGGIARKRLIR